MGSGVAEVACVPYHLHQTQNLRQINLGNTIMGYISWCRSMQLKCMLRIQIRLPRFPQGPFQDLPTRASVVPLDYVPETSRIEPIQDNFRVPVHNVPQYHKCISERGHHFLIIQREIPAQ